jgi:hypothetical protein
MLVLSWKSGVNIQVHDGITVVAHEAHGIQVQTCVDTPMQNSPARMKFCRWSNAFGSNRGDRRKEADHANGDP